MGELLAGRSATWPTFSRLMSVRTRMDLQYSQTVCTLADQRNVIVAPQFGQFAVGCVTGCVPQPTVRDLRERRPPNYKTSVQDGLAPKSQKIFLPDAIRSPTRRGAHSRTNSDTGIRTQERCGRRDAIRPAGIGQ